MNIGRQEVNVFLFADDIYVGDPQNAIRELLQLMKTCN
jgi:DNA polymerase III delta subunit